MPVCIAPAAAAIPAKICPIIGPAASALVTANAVLYI